MVPVDYPIIYPTSSGLAPARHLYRCPDFSIFRLIFLAVALVFELDLTLEQVLDHMLDFLIFVLARAHVLYEDFVFELAAALLVAAQLLRVWQGRFVVKALVAWLVDSRVDYLAVRLESRVCQSPSHGCHLAHVNSLSIYFGLS